MIALALTLALSAAPPAGSVVLGVSTVDGTETEIVVVTPAGERETIGTIAHARGHVPKGVLVGDRLLTVARVPDDTAGVLEETLLSTGARTLLVGGVMTTHAPALDASGAVLAVRQLDERRFSILRVAPGAQRAPTVIEATWVTPASGAPGTFLVVDGARSRVVTLGEGGAVERAQLGAGRFRSAALVGEVLAIERASGAGRAEVVSAAASGPTRDAQRAVPTAVVARGLVGMDPLACGAHVVVGAGEKRASVHVLRAERGAFVVEERLTSARAGVASPRACAEVDGAPVVIAWLDRGAALPGELWRLSRAGSAPVWPAAQGVAVEVYGVIGGATANGGGR